MIYNKLLIYLSRFCFAWFLISCNQEIHYQSANELKIISDVTKKLSRDLSAEYYYMDEMDYDRALEKREIMNKIIDYQRDVSFFADSCLVVNCCSESDIVEFNNRLDSYRRFLDNSISQNDHNKLTAKPIKDAWTRIDKVVLGQNCNSKMLTESIKLNLVTTSALYHISRGIP